MTYEVERKYRLIDSAALCGLLAKRGAEFGQPELQVDVYYAHPSRDFAQTDEALRIRRVGERAYITYKGPKVDHDSKTRREIELPLTGGLAGALDHAALLEALGFRAVANVTKRRRKAALAWRGLAFEIALDNVDSVGQFVELETSADETEVEAAGQCLASLAEELNLRDGERRSYLELLLSSG